MAIQTIIMGATPNDGKGDSIRAAFVKTNANFVALQADIGATTSALTDTKGKANGIAPLNASAVIDDAHLKNSGATAGTYGSSTAVGTVTIDAKGRVTAASTVNIRAATTSVSGIVQLSSATNSTSAALAATPAAVKAAYDLANAAVAGAQKGAANGVATLDAKGKVPLSQLELPISGQYLGTQAVKAISYNAQTITENVVIPGDVNAMSAGPIAIANGKTVTVSDGATWTVV